MIPVSKFTPNHEAIERNKCPECGSSNTIITNNVRGEIACSNCGVLLDTKIIDENIEWRNFEGHGKERDRVGPANDTELLDSGMSTSIKGVSKYNPIKRYCDRSNLEAPDRSLTRGNNKIIEFAKELNLGNDTIELSRDIFRKISKRRKLKGRNIDAVASAVIYIACKHSSDKRSIEDIVKTSETKKKEVSKCISLIKQIVSYRPYDPSLQISQAITPICGKLNLPHKIENKAISIYQKIGEKKLVEGKNPFTVVGAVIYLSCLLSDNSALIDDIAFASGKTVPTIKKILKELYFHRAEILAEEDKNKIELLKEFTN